MARGLHHGQSFTILSVVIRYRPTFFLPPLALTAFTTVAVHGQLQPLQINEILVVNETGIDDGNDSREDWIEIFNPNDQLLNLDTYFLTDDPEALTKWNFPAVNIPANGYLLVFASGNDTTDPDGNPHTNFKLSSGGEFLALVKPDGTSIDDQFEPNYPEQFTDVSYGRPVGGGSFVYFGSPTPGAVNNAGKPGVVKDTNFSMDRGFYDAPFDLAILSDTDGATIRYTTNGSIPTLTNGTTYTDPISITSTTNVRAAAFFPSGDFIPTNVDTHTYIFVDQVADQSANPPGWSSDWGFDDQVGQIIVSDYAMDQRVADDVAGLRAPGYTLRDALLDIPSVSLTLKQSDFVKSQAEKAGNNGLSLYGTPRVRDFEPVCSVEYLLPDGSRGFQEDCKVETHGNSSRTPFRMQKHSLRLTFSSEVGVGKLRYDLFPDSPVDEFNKLVLRACFTDSWALNTWASARYRPNDSLYTRDVFMKAVFGDMGHPTSYGNFVHLYVNGLYFGVHNLTERLEDDFYAEHLGGDKEDWEVNADLSTPGPLWNSLLATLNGPITTEAGYNAVKEKLDVVNYADWIILHLFGDAEDWPNKNSYAAVNAVSGDGKWRFNVWDQEIAFDKYTWNRYDSTGTGMIPFQRLRLNEDFRTLFADRVYKHMFDGGSLSLPRLSATFLDICDEIDKAIVAESVRWGDVQASTPYGNTTSSSSNIENDFYPPTINNPIYFTREQHWVTERDNVISNYFPTLHDQSQSRSFIRELRSRDLYPDVDPPVFSQLGGVVPVDFTLSLITDNGAIYYTTDGSDPRESGGGVNPRADTFGGPASEELVSIDSTGWTYLSIGQAQSDSNVVFGAAGYGPTDWKHPLFNDSSWLQNLEAPFAGPGDTSVDGITPNTLIDFGGFGARWPTSYFRKDFQVTDAADFFELNVSAIRDDKMIVYLNGREIYRDDFGMAVVTHDDFALSTISETVPATFIYTLSPGELVEGMNTLAIEVHSEKRGDSDIGLQVEIFGKKTGPGGNTLNLTSSGTVKARTLSDGGEWSPLREADFIVGTPAAAGNLVISEIMYNPQGPDDDREFIEILNINPSVSVDLTDVSFTDGILYTFPTGFILGPLERVVVVQNRDAFVAEYGDTGIIIADGTYTSNLSNSGETIVLIDNAENEILSFSYDDNAALGWPTAADGFGPSLELISPLASPDHGLAASWRASANAKGSPGSGELVGANLEDDADSDGINVLGEYFFGLSDDSSDLNPTTLTATADGFIFSFARNPFPVGINWEIQSSNNLKNWDTATEITSGPVTLGADGRLNESGTIPLSDVKRFYRVIVTPAP